MTYKQIINELHKLGNPEINAYKQKKFGVHSTNALGIYMKDLNALLKQIPKDDELAMQLFDSEIYEAKILCSKLFKPKNLTPAQMEKFILSFDNWEICDSFSMKLFARSNHAVAKIYEWSNRSKEFEKRASFATMAAYCMADKKSTNDVFLPFLELIQSASKDDRIYVRKAVNWALRSIGKRNVDLQQAVIAFSEELSKSENKTTQWIAKDALKELQQYKVRISDYPRAIYRKD